MPAFSKVLVKDSIAEAVFLTSGPTVAVDQAFIKYDLRLGDGNRRIFQYGYGRFWVKIDERFKEQLLDDILEVLGRKVITLRDLRIDIRNRNGLHDLVAIEIVLPLEDHQRHRLVIVEISHDRIVFDPK